MMLTSQNLCKYKSCKYNSSFHGILLPYFHGSKGGMQLSAYPLKKQIITLHLLCNCNSCLLLTLNILQIILKDIIIS